VFFENEFFWEFIYPPLGLYLMRRTDSHRGGNAAGKKFGNKRILLIHSRLFKYVG
jgi:hypothetical protein